MRNFYTDESGTSGTNQVRVVVVLVVDPDKDWVPAAQQTFKIAAAIPQQYLSIPFHAAELMDGSKFKDWDIEERRAFVHAMMILPRMFSVPLVWGAVSSGVGIPHDIERADGTVKALSQQQSDHLHAFAMATGTADWFVREHCPGEMAQLIAEDTQEMQDYLVHAVRSLRVKPLRVPANEGKTQEVRLARVIDDVHFLSKHAFAPFLKAADSCAYGLRRYFEGRPGGEECLRSIAGDKIELPGITVGWSSGILNAAGLTGSSS